MSVLFKTDDVFYISHETYVNKIYKCMEEKPIINPNLFKIVSQYGSNRNISKTKKRTEQIDDKFMPLQLEVDDVKAKYLKIFDELSKHEVFNIVADNLDNKEALITADHVYQASGKTSLGKLFGSNFENAAIKKIQNTEFIFPKNCTFYNQDIRDIQLHLKEKYDLIVLDPPWWNKYIRRKRKKCDNAYDMLYNKDFKNIPIENLLDDNGIVVIWCTNSLQHLTSLTEEIFTKWEVNFIAKWFWLKVTKSGEPICNFSVPPGKQPFEQIIFGCKGDANRKLPKNGNIVISVPNAIHSHKPPLVEVLKEFLPENPKCLEIFARNLLPNWTSYGNEVLRFQHISLFQMTN